MRTEIYYFTGTGNSLVAAKRIGAALGETEIIPLVKMRKTDGRVKPQAKRVGLVFPVHRFTVSEIVTETLPKLDLTGARYVFVVMTMGGLGNGAVRYAKDLITEGCGRAPDASFALTMPNNFAPMQKPPAGPKLTKKLARSEKRMEGIIESIASGKSVGPGWDPLSVALLALTKGGMEKNRGKGDNFYKVDERCTGCGACKKVCPVNNISMDEKTRPIWNHRCTNCAACLNFCPTQAIQMKVMLGSEGRGRYHHPDVTIKDISAQKGDA